MNSDDLSNFDAPPPEESSNRTFLVAAGILGGIVLLSIACLAGYVLLYRPSQVAQQSQAATAQAVQNAQVAAALTATSAGHEPSVADGDAAPDANAGGRSANARPRHEHTPIRPRRPWPPRLTEAALAQLTQYPTATELPGTGVADQYGAPGLVIMGMALVAVIFLARRLRATPTK